MIYTELTKKAMKFAFHAHNGQTDKSGVPYIYHPIHLAEQMTDEYSTVVALLHDVVEDTQVTFDEIEHEGYPAEVISALKSLTHDKAVPYLDYVASLKNNSIASAVKLADLRHNSELSRLNAMTDKAIARVEKYKQAITILTSDAPHIVEVVAALIWDETKFMICQRPANKARGLLWEFVGWKVESGETKQQALVRECEEELSITISVGSEFMDVLHEYPDLTVHLTLFNANIAEGVPKMLEHADIRWITIAEISNFEFCPADQEILDTLKKIKKYNKLVRDKIPEIITASGKQCVCETLPDNQYLKMLDAKLSEELAEYQDSKSIEELADLMEVMLAVTKARGHSMDNLEHIREEKAVERGGFEKKILLKEVIDT